jgi:hypothetical protein
MRSGARDDSQRSDPDLPFRLHHTSIAENAIYCREPLITGGLIIIILLQVVQPKRERKLSRRSLTKEAGVIFLSSSSK